MDKINKNKKIALIVLAVIVAITVILSIVGRFEAYSFKKWVYDTYSTATGSQKITMDKPGFIVSIVSTVISIGMWGTFIGLAFKYSVSKSPKIQGRRWPYIVMLIIGGISALYGIYTVTKDFQGAISLGASVDSTTITEINTHFTDHYSIIKIMSILDVVFNALIAVLSLIGLLYLIKMRNAKASQMTNEVLQTGIEENKAKDIEENDLP